MQYDNIVKIYKHSILYNFQIMERKIKRIGQIWKSQTNGFVYDVSGISPAIISGAHGSSMPKILVCVKRKH